MLRSFACFVLRCRLENVMAAGISAVLVTLVLTTRLFHSFTLGMHDFIFILLPVGVLGIKSLLGLLASTANGPDDSADTSKFLRQFFQPFVKIFRDWFPFLLLSACYFSLFSNLVLRVNPHTADAFLSRVDGLIFLGHQPALLLEPWIQPGITELLNIIYFSFVLFLPAVALYFYVRKQELAFRRVMMGYLTIILMGVASYILVPAAGPEQYLANLFTRGLDGRTLSRGVDFIMKSARVSFDCFPSLHVGIPLLLSFYLRDYCRKAFIPALLYVALMCAATIYLRYHYFIDVIMAFAYAPAAYWLNDILLTRWPGEQRFHTPISAPDADDSVATAPAPEIAVLES